VSGDLGRVDNDSGVPSEAGADPDGFIGTNPGFIRVSPETTTLEIADGNTSGKSVAYTAEQKQPDGSWAPTTLCSWSLGNVDVGALSGATFNPSGNAGGVTEVTCTIGDAHASAKLTISIKDALDNGSGLDAQGKTNLVSSVAADPTVGKLLYPNDKTVFPRGLTASPELMWTAPSAQDVYAAVYEEPFAKVTAFFKAPNPGRFPLPIAEWNKLTASNPDGALKVTLYRLSGATAYVGPTQTWTTSRANLKGTVYFWQVTTPTDGNVVKMQFGKAPAAFLQSNGECTGCHAVSRNGTTVAAGTSVNGSNSAYDIKTGTQYFKKSGWSGYHDITPDGSLVAYVPVTSNDNYHGGPVTLADSKTGTDLSGTGLETFGLTSTPTFSGDSKAMAFSVRNQPNASDQQHNVFHDSDLALADFDLKNKKASNKRTLVHANNGETLIFPSFTPDGKRVAYQNGNQSRARSSGQYGWTQPASRANLDIVDADGTNIVELAAANDGAEARNFHPIFSPVVQGGYFWVVFTSLRTYGNRLTNVQDQTFEHCSGNSWADCRSRQLWVAAVDAQGKPTVDPSHPAFWLPGQEVTRQNFDAFWSLDVCKANGDSCEAGFECCEGTCRVDNGKKSCGTRLGCAQDGDTCAADKDCCGGASCVGGVCSVLVK
jgi:hypothetical protein